MDEPSEEARDAQHASEMREHQREEDAQQREEVLLTTRFEHARDRHGHHVVLGREGKITRCEDEPIRIPGAVQGFGVLIALREDDDTGNFAVRQVSENSTEILGLSPKYLFGLECFTDTLPEDQADVLWDNLRFLSNLTPDGSDPNDGAPQVFLLNGFGEPGSAAVEDPLQVELGRRRWSCWCAVHRPPQQGDADASQAVVAVGKDDTPPPPLLVLEFELDNDHLNPLYPPPTSTADSSGGSSRSGGSAGSGPNSTGSADSGDSLGTGSTISSSSQLADVRSRSVDSVVTTMPDSDSQIALTAPGQGMSSGDTLQPVSAEEQTWYPTTEEVLASTTSRAKPLRELERIRAAGGGNAMRYRLGVGQAMPSMPAPGTSSPAPGGAVSGLASPASEGPVVSRMERRRQKSERMSAGAAASVDIFTVLGQANDQLSAATDLETFLHVVAGLVKDLTQFHRCVLSFRLPLRVSGGRRADVPQRPCVSV